MKGLSYFEGFESLWINNTPAMKSEEPSFGAIFPIISKKLSNNPNRDSKISEK